MLVTILNSVTDRQLHRCWWQVDVGDSFWMLMTEFRYWWHIWDVNAVSSCSNIKDVDDENCQNRRQDWRSQFYSIDWNWMLVTVLNLMVPYVLKGDVYGQRWKNVNHNVYLWDTNFYIHFVATTAKSVTNISILSTLSARHFVFKCDVTFPMKLTHHWNPTGIILILEPDVKSSKRVRKKIFCQTQYMMSE